MPQIGTLESFTDGAAMLTSYHDGRRRNPSSSFARIGCYRLMRTAARTSICLSHIEGLTS